MLDTTTRCRQALGLPTTDPVPADQVRLHWNEITDKVPALAKEFGLDEDTLSEGLCEIDGVTDENMDEVLIPLTAVVDAVEETVAWNADNS